MNLKKKNTRRILSLLLALSMLFTLTAMASAAGLKGDANSDGEVTVSDITMVKNLILAASWTDNELTAGDFDGDGKLTVLDIVCIKRRILHPEEAEKNDSPYEGYSLVWADEFDGNSLNRNDWNVELHDPGWVNNELQKYVDSTNNIYVRDGVLTIQPIKTVDGNGNTSYTSGRVNTQYKHDFTYGIFEARLRVPAGQGYLPAFWLMTTTEEDYGYWPRCGEIDIMEVLGHDTNTNYGTIHYGNPYASKQSKYDLASGNFSDEYHTYALEWEPGRLRWYIDGNLFGEQTSWYSSNDDGSLREFPAPFNHDFYIILNLAVGGNWPGSPNSSTNFNDNYQIDYVRVYQKDSGSVSGANLIENGDFSNGSTGWNELSVVSPGTGSLNVTNGEAKVSVTNVGDQDWCVQMLKTGIPLENGGTYRLTFTASSTAERGISVNMMSCDGNYTWYGGFTPTITTGKQTYTLDFTMSAGSNSNVGLYISMGKMADGDTPTSTITLDDFSLVRIS